MLTQAIKKAKGDEEKKIGVSLKMPESFKNELQNIPDENSVSLNALIIAMLQTVCEAKESSTSDYDRVLEIGIEIRAMDELIEKNIPTDLLGYEPSIAKVALINEMNKINKNIESKE